MKNTVAIAAAACIVVALAVGILLGAVLFPAPSKDAPLAVAAAPQRPPKPAQAPASADASRPAQPAAISPQPEALPKPAADPERFGYYYGRQIATMLKTQGINVDARYAARGIHDGLTGSPSLLTDQELQEAGLAFQKAIAAASSQRQPAAVDPAAAEKNLQESKAFLEQNAKNEGVKTTPSGLQYKILKSGDPAGQNPKPTDTVTVHYRGTLLDGTEFDSSYKRNEPATFPVNGVIKGWTEALQLMKPGDKWQLWIPPDLGYGERSPGGPNRILVFEVELLGVKSP